MSADYEKLEEEIEGMYMKVERKAIEIFKGHFNFIKNLRKFITSEFALLEKQILRSAVLMCVLFIVADLLSIYLLEINIKIPTYIKGVVLAILIALTERTRIQKLLKW